MYAARRDRPGQRPKRAWGVRSWLFFSSILALAACLVGGDAQASIRKAQRSSFEPGEPELVEVPVTVHVALRDGLPVVSRHHVLESVARANRELREFGVELRVRAVELMPDGYEDLVRVRHRMRLAQRAPRDGSAHVFFVDKVELSNPRYGDRRVSGMHWRYRGVRPGLRQREYLAVAHDAPLTTFVHEVGHVFGLGHRHQNDNVMCSCQRVPTPSFTTAQGRQLRGGARRFLVRASGR
jgi:hypothetical protein